MRAIAFIALGALLIQVGITGRLHNQEMRRILDSCSESMRELTALPLYNFTIPNPIDDYDSNRVEWDTMGLWKRLQFIILWQIEYF